MPPPILPSPMKAMRAMFSSFVIPAKAGIHELRVLQLPLDPGLRRDDG